MESRAWVVAAVVAGLIGAFEAGAAERGNASTPGALEIPVNASTRLGFSCQQSATGVCHNTLIAETGSVTDQFAVTLGQTRHLYDVPESRRLCVTDAPLRDLADCKTLHRIGDLIAPMRRR
jgi:hypothetical protein